MNAMLNTLLATASAVSLLTATPATAQFPYAEHRQNDRGSRGADQPQAAPRPDQTDSRSADPRSQNQGRPPGSPDPRPNQSQGGSYQQPGYTQPATNYPQPAGSQPGYQNQQPSYGQNQQPGNGQNQPGYGNGNQPGYGQNRPGYGYGNGNGNQPGYGHNRPDYDRNRPDHDRRDYDRDRPGYGYSYNQPGYGQPGYGYQQPGYARPGYGYPRASYGYTYRPGYGPGYGRNGVFDYDYYRDEWQINRLDALVGLYPGQAYELRRLDAFYGREFAYAPRNPEVYQRLQYEKMQAVLAILTPLQRDRLFAQDYYRQYNGWNRGNYGPGYGNQGYVAPSYGGGGYSSQGY